MFPNNINSKMIHVVDGHFDNCIVTINTGNRQCMEYTQELMTYYAVKIKADFKIVTSDDLTDDLISQLNMLKIKTIHDLLQVYKRVILFDNNCCINKKTPDLFKIVTNNELGGQQEGLLPYVSNYIRDYRYVKEKTDFQLDKCKYLSTAVLVVSKKHQFLFDNKSINDNKFFFESSHQQAYINYLIQKNDIKLKLLPIKFNNPRVFPIRFAGEQSSHLILDEDYIKNNFIMRVTDYYQQQIYYLQQIRDIYTNYTARRQIL